VGDISSLPVDFVAIAHQRLSRRLIRRIQRQGHQVYAWTLNDSGSMVSAIDAGVDGIITDDPQLARRVLQELEALSATGRLLLRFRSLVVDPAE
jgi:glycerophosphoryl diester phosphodiesterase